MIVKVHRPDLWEPVAPESPPIITKVHRLADELGRWRAAGMPVAARAVRIARRSICEAPCKYWSAHGNLGMGECRAPGCGCTRAKRWLATAECPLGLWPRC